MGVEAGAERTLSVRRQTLPGQRGAAEAHAAHAADDSHAAGNQRAAWAARPGGKVWLEISPGRHPLLPPADWRPVCAGSDHTGS